MTRLVLKCLILIVLMSCSSRAAEATLVEKARKGDANAQRKLGDQYFNGEGVPENSAEAAKWYRKSAEQGNAEAQFSLGLLSNSGDGVVRNRAEAITWYRKAAEQGHAEAQYNLGHAYSSGKVVAKDVREAVKWFRRAAEQGDTAAKFWLGHSYANGIGIAKDDVVAVKWFREAAREGNSNAQGYLGAAYANGEGVPRDTIEALAWSNIAAASGDKLFVTNRDTLERQLGPEAALLAQQRSKQIYRDIESTLTSPNPKGSTAAISPEVGAVPKASGSGVIVSRAGHILTAAHVVAGASRLKIFTAQGPQIANVLRIDEANDLAVIKLAVGTYRALPVTTSRKIRLGQTVATIGFPNIEIQGFSPKVTRGEISSLNGIGDDPRAWQISVPVQPGNSGGALLDENGNVIGVVLSKLGLKAVKATGDIPQNVNYAVKSTYALALLEPYLDGSTPEPNQSASTPRFEDMVAKAQQSVVLILVY